MMFLQQMRKLKLKHYLSRSVPRKLRCICKPGYDTLRHLL